MLLKRFIHRFPSCEDRLRHFNSVLLWFLSPFSLYPDYVAFSDSRLLGLESHGQCGQGREVKVQGNWIFTLISPLTS